MKYFFHSTILFVIFLITTVGLNAQPFSLDETWDTGEYPGYTAWTIGIIIEKDIDRILYWGSAWPFNQFSIARYQFSQGALDVILGTSPNAPRDIQRLPDGGYLIYGSGYPMQKYNSDGNKDWTFTENLNATTSNHTTRGGKWRVYIYPDGRILAGCGYPCLGLWHKPDQHQAPFRLLPDGQVDSTFNVSSNGGVAGTLPYDDSLLLVYGLFMEYDNVPMFAIARIDTAGVLDTTFQSPFVYPTIVFANHIDDNGKIMVTGSCYLPGNDTIYALLRLNPDGSVDESFKKIPQQTIMPGVSIYDVQQTSDGGYLIVGDFHHIRGTPRRSIAKLYADGSLDENYFTGEGLVLDTADLSKRSFAQRILYDNEEDHYYIVGREMSFFNGKKIPRVIRLKGLISSTSTPASAIHTFGLFPNPANESITITFPEVLRHYGNFLVEIHNQLGQRVLADQSGSKTLQIGHLPAGMYFVHLKAEEVHFKVQKLIVLK